MLKSASFMPTMAQGTVTTGDPAGLVAAPVEGNMGAPSAPADAGNANVGMPGYAATQADLLKMEK